MCFLFSAVLMSTAVPQKAYATSWPATAFYPGNNQVLMVWSKTPAITNVTVYRATSPSGPWTGLRGGISAVAYWDDSVTNGITYYYRFTGRDSAGVTVNSDVFNTTPNYTGDSDHDFYAGDYTSSTYIGDSLPGRWRPFSDNSPWNTPIAGSPSIHPDSSSIISRMAERWRANTGLSTQPFLDFANANYAIPVHVVNSGNIGIKLVRTTSDIWDAFDTNHDGGADKHAYITNASQCWPEVASDGHMCIIDPFKKLTWEFSRCSVDSSSNLSCTTFNVWDLTGTGVAVPYQGMYHWARGGRGAGTPEIAGLVRPEEIEAGEIRHALCFCFSDNRPGACVAPAARSDGKAEHQYNPYEGARLQLNPALTDADLNAWGLGPAAKVVARALQRYGMIDVDNGGGITIQGQNLHPVNATSRAMWESRCPNLRSDLQKIPWNQFRVLSYGTIYYAP